VPVGKYFGFAFVLTSMSFPKTPENWKVKDKEKDSIEGIEGERKMDGGLFPFWGGLFLYVYAWF